ncbi:MAG: PD40 domain-containing protein [Candidatus Marinimicrobia bacterium]|nr:PD40 domain-containing protein [Candidatus Neomarinimicrobiota bacterium]
MNLIKTSLLLIALPLYMISAHAHAAQQEADAESDTSAAKDKEKEWDVTASHGPTTELKFDTDEGTWMSLDVSPDGKTIVFDLLGDIYSMSITGGQANRLTSGPAWDVQPAYSPDGKSIAITSDRGGADNIWIIGTEGGDPKEVTKEKDRIMNNPVYTPDGQYIIARKHYRNTRSLGAGEMWIYHIDGGKGMAVSKRRDWQHDAGEPDVSPDGKYLYYSQDISPGSTYQYNRNPYGRIYAIDRIDLDSGEFRRLVNGFGGSMTPQISPDGKTLAFIRRVQLKTALFVKDLASGDERMLYDNLNRDSQETWSHFGTNPGYSWTPNGKNIIISAKGKFWKVALSSGKATAIPFKAEVEQTLTDAVHFTTPVGGGTFQVKTVLGARVKPRGGEIVFQALGHIYKAKTNGSGRKRLTRQGDHFEYSPAWSPNGKRIALVTWDDVKGGGIAVLSASSGRGKNLPLPQGHYHDPAWSPDGKQLVYRKSGGSWLRGFKGGADPGIYVIPAAGGKPRKITSSGSRPRFTADGKRIYLDSREDDDVALITVDLNGEDRQVIAKGKFSTYMSPSPDGNWIAFKENYNVYVAAMPRSGKTVSLSSDMSQLPVAKASRDGAESVHWSGNSKTVRWTIGSMLYERKLTDLFDFLPGAPDSLPGPDTTGIALGWKAKTNQPKGTVVLAGATVITVDEAGIIPDAVIVITDGRIAALGSRANTTVPKGAKTIDVSGKFIIPGLIDVHAHLGNAGDGITPQQNWGYLANLAFGVTTTHDPSSGTQNVFANSELQKSGTILGPRIYSTGTILYGAESSGAKAVVNSLDDARAHLRRIKAFGGFTVKSYNQPRRDQRQQILKAARELGMMVHPEGGSTLQWNLNMILDGHTGIEHSIPVSPLYKDVLTLYGESNVAYTPTLVVSYGGIFGENYWYQHSKVFEHQRLLAFTPRELLDSRARRRMHVEDDDYNHIENAKAAKALSDAGVPVSLGAHGQLDGLAAHWELWMFVQGGMTPLEALQSATINGATYLGMEADLGSLKVGKLADLLVLSANPLEDIRNSELVERVMLGGRLYDAATLNQQWPTATRRKPLYWQR